MSEARLVLEDGEVFEGESFGAPAEVFGEVVFNTGMTGYQEVMTDPSYAGQIVTMTYPQIGNYGVNPDDVESSSIRVNGFVVRNVPATWSSWRGKQSIDDYLSDAGIPGILGVDTRRLTRHIRDAGAMRGAISAEDPAKVLERIRAWPEMTGLDLVPSVTTDGTYDWPAPDQVRYRVAAIDFGIKHNILRMLSEHGCAVTVYPASTPAGQILADEPNGLFLSNGPGDPEAVGYGIETITELIGRVPLFGICLGHQLMARALGFDTFKLRFGHRGVNHPVIRLSDGSIEITTQNHGFAVEAEPFGLEAPSSPAEAIKRDLVANSKFGPVQLTHVNLNDYTVEGMKLLSEPAFSVQYHPEAGPGPHDARYLFSEFIELMDREGG